MLLLIRKKVRVGKGERETRMRADGESCWLGTIASFKMPSESKGKNNEVPIGEEIQGRTGGDLPEKQCKQKEVGVSKRVSPHVDTMAIQSCTKQWPTILPHSLTLSLSLSLCSLSPTHFLLLLLLAPQSLFNSIPDFLLLQLISPAFTTESMNLTRQLQKQ